MIQEFTEDNIRYLKKDGDDLFPQPPCGHVWVYDSSENGNFVYRAATIQKHIFNQTGDRREFETGAHRDANNDKGRMDLIPWLAVIRNSKHFQKGAATHGERNWEKGIPISVLLDSGMRHLAKAMAGLTDENHIDAGLWNIFCAVETLERIKLGTMDAKLNDVKGLT